MDYYHIIFDILAHTNERFFFLNPKTREIVRAREKQQQPTSSSILNTIVIVGFFFGQFQCRVCASVYLYLNSRVPRSYVNFI